MYPMRPEFGHFAKTGPKKALIMLFYPFLHLPSVYFELFPKPHAGELKTHTGDPKTTSGIACFSKYSPLVWSGFHQNHVRFHSNQTLAWDGFGETHQTPELSVSLTTRLFTSPECDFISKSCSGSLQSVISNPSHTLEMFRVWFLEIIKKSPWQKLIWLFYHSLSILSRVFCP